MNTQQTQEMAPRQGAGLEHVRGANRVTPPVDVYENAEELLVVLDVPGVVHDAVTIQLDGADLEVEARQAAVDGEQPVVFARSFRVPRTIDAAKVAAEIDGGVLTLHLPKTEAAKPRRINVKTA